MSGQDAGFPPGITAGHLGRRVVAYIIDAVVPMVLWGAASTAFVLVDRGDVRLVLGLAAGLLSLGWLVLLWWSQGTRGASPGMRVMQLEVVTVENGRPMGWLRAIIRSLVFLGLGATGVGSIVMLVMLIMHPRRQGWHDLASRSVVITAREAAPASPELAEVHTPAPRAGIAAGTVGLPAGLGGAAAGTAPPAQQYPQPGGFPPAQQPPVAAGQPGVMPTSAPAQLPGAAPAAAGQPPMSTQPAASIQGLNPFFTGGSQPAAAGGGPAVGQPEGSGGADDGPADSTRLVQRTGVQRRPDQGWSIVLGDGRQVAVESLVLIGRNPQPRAGEEGAELVSVGDNSRTVSKTHIAVGVDTRGAWVMDRGSTNGSAVATSSGAFEPCVAGDRVRVREGQVVSFGEQRFEIRRTYPGQSG